MDPVREFLESARWERLRAARLAKRVAQITTQVEHITPSYSGMPGGGSIDVSAAWTYLAQVRLEYEEQLDKSERRIKEVSEFIDTLPTPEYREILAWRYGLGLRWTEVREGIKAAGMYYTERQIFRLHGQALNEAREIWRETHNEESRNS